MKKQVKKEIKNKKIEPVKKENKNGLFWVITIMVSILALIMLIYFFINSFNSFEFQGLQFTKEKFGNLDIYHHAYNFADADGQQYVYNLYLRSDPRENDVPVKGDIEFYQEGSLIYIAINATDLAQCSNSSVALSSLTGFLSNNMFRVKGVSSDPAEAKSLNTTYANCESYPGNVMLYIQRDSKTSIGRYKNCYIMKVKDCNIVEVAEKFQVQSIIDARNRKA